MVRRRQVKQGRSVLKSVKTVMYQSIIVSKLLTAAAKRRERQSVIEGRDGMKYIIKEQQCGYLMKNGRFVKLLTAGKYRYMKEFGYEVQTVTMTGSVDTRGIPKEVLLKDPAFASKVKKLEVPDTCIVIRFVSHSFREVLNGPELLYWNVFEENEFKLIDITAESMEESLPRIYFDLMPVKYYKKIVIKDGEIGLLYFDNQFKRKLEAGSHFFWNYGKEVSCKIFNMKIQQLDVNGQEILTADKVGIRLNVVVSYRITNPERLVDRVEGASAQLYTCAQLAIREYVGRFALDAMLAQKEEMGAEILKRLKEKEEDFCLEVLDAGVKDIILPGEIRDIMNTVLVAEKKAQANVIMRREEVASTRSLLNTAKLMEENQTLLKLKEMEYLERICDKVDSITLGGGRGVLEQLSELAGAGRCG